MTPTAIYITEEYTVENGEKKLRSRRTDESFFPVLTATSAVQQSSPQPAPPSPEAPPAEEPAKKRGRPPKNAAPAPVATADEIDLDGGGSDNFLDDVPAEPPAKKLELADVRKALVDYQKVSSADAARKILKEKGGADTLSALKPESFQAVFDAATKATKG